MVSIFLTVVAVVSFFWGAFLLYETETVTGVFSVNDVLVPLLTWTVAAVCFGSAAVLDGIRTATRKMSDKLDELAGPSS